MYALIANENYYMHFCNLQLLYSIEVDNFCMFYCDWQLWILNFHGNLLSALIHLKIFTCNYQIDNRQANKETNRLTDIMTYRAAIAAINIQFFSWGWGSVTKQLSFFLLIQISNVIVCFYFFRREGVAVLSEKSFEFYSYSLITFVFLDFSLLFDVILLWCHFEPF